MKAFLFAAGIGSRLGDIVKDIPKCMLAGGGNVPMIERWLWQLVGASSVTYNTHHFPDIIQDHLRQRFPNDFEAGNLRQFNEPELLGTAVTLAYNEYRLAGTIILVYCDVWTRFNILDLVLHHNANGADLTLGICHRDNPEECGVVETDENMRVIGIEEKPKDPKGNQIWSGMAIVESRALSLIPCKSHADIARDWFPRIITNDAFEVLAYPITDPVIDIGTPEGLERARNESLR